MRRSTFAETCPGCNRRTLYQICSGKVCDACGYGYPKEKAAKIQPFGPLGGEWMNEPLRVGDHIVYPLTGVAVVEEIQSGPIGGELIYRLKFFGKEMGLLLPVRKWNLKARRLSSPEKMQEALAILSVPPSEPFLNYKSRYSVYMKKMQENDPVLLAEVIRDLHCINKKMKTLPFREFKMFEKAKTLFLGELASVGGIPFKEAEQVFETALNA